MVTKHFILHAPNSTDVPSCEPSSISGRFVPMVFAQRWTQVEEAEASWWRRRRVISRRWRRVIYQPGHYVQRFTVVRTKAQAPFQQTQRLFLVVFLPVDVDTPKKESEEILQPLHGSSNRSYLRLFTRDWISLLPCSFSYEFDFSKATIVAHALFSSMRYYLSTPFADAVAAITWEFKNIILFFFFCIVLNK